MKKIRNEKQLHRELEHLQERQQQLEKNMQERWRRIRKCIRPQNVAKDVISRLL